MLLAESKTLTYWVAADWLNGFAQIYGTAIVMYHEHPKHNLVLDTMSDWQPVQLLQRRTDMIAR